CDKIRILVTHQIQFIRKATQILVLNDEGKCLGLGSYDELQSRGLDFMSILSDQEREADDKAEQNKEDCDQMDCLTTKNNRDVIIYSSMMAALFIASLLRAITWFVMFMRASVNLHNSMFYRLLRAPISVFDSNPIAQSPVFSHVSTTFNGLASVRAFGAQEVFEKQFYVYQDDHSATWMLVIAATHAFGLIIDVMCFLYTVIIFVVFMVFPGQLGAGESGLALSSALMLTAMTEWGVRQSAEVESQMTSVERIIEYSKLPQEAALTAHDSHKPPPDWPQKGQIELKDMSLCYEGSDKPECVVRMGQPILLGLMTAKLTDTRLRHMVEIISGMRVIKMYSWEQPFADLVAEARNFITLESPFPTLQNISVHLRPGDLLAVIGPVGAGKDHTAMLYVNHNSGDAQRID
ncbi:unnamed protein product, partial [Medioppia subpectinata]